MRKESLRTSSPTSSSTCDDDDAKPEDNEKV